MQSTTPRLCYQMSSSHSWLSRTFRRATRTRSKSTTPEMCPLNRIAHIANHAATRRLQTPASPALLDSELADLTHLVSSVSLEHLAMEKLVKDGPDMTYIPVAEAPQFCIAVFVMPKGSKLPLHDHPGMFVITRVLWGCLRVDEFDLEGNDCVAVRQPVMFAREGEVRTLGPNKGNVHAFTAMENTAVLDVLVPPYDDDVGCRYYDTVDIEGHNDRVQLEVGLKNPFCS